MFKLARYLLAAFLLAVVFDPAEILAHGGGLDRNGCHTNRKTGDYHCHRASSSRPAPAPRPRPSSPSRRDTTASPSPQSLLRLSPEATPREVRWARQILETLGYPAGRGTDPTDSSYLRALRDFQSDRDLRADGRLSRETILSLAQATSEALRDCRSRR